MTLWTNIDDQMLWIGNETKTVHSMNIKLIEIKSKVQQLLEAQYNEEIMDSKPVYCWRP